MDIEGVGIRELKLGVVVVLLVAVVGGAYLVFADRTVEISNAEELQQIREDLDGHYVLVDDIDLSHIDNFEPIGGQFTGTFDGNGHTISGLTIDHPEEDQVGLFRLVADRPQQGTIKSVGLEGAEVTGNSTVGILAGSNRGRVLGSYASGKINGNEDVGGIVGLNFGGIIENSYFTGNVSGSKGVGGLSGTNVGSIDDSYTASNVAGNEQVGGLVGKNRTSYTPVLNPGDAADTYWDINLTGQTSSAGGIGLTTGEMTGSAARENMGDFEFEETWRTTEDDYPRLAWQSKEDEGEGENE